VKGGGGYDEHRETICWGEGRGGWDVGRNGGE
jgi:hypothetical protein